MRNNAVAATAACALYAAAFAAASGCTNAPQVSPNPAGGPPVNRAEEQVKRVQQDPKIPADVREKYARLVREGKIKPDGTPAGGGDVPVGGGLGNGANPHTDRDKKPGGQRKR